MSSSGGCDVGASLEFGLARFVELGVAAGLKNVSSVRLDIVLGVKEVN